MQTMLLSALFAGLVAVLVTMAIERWGGIVGGILGTIPTTIIRATIGIYLEAGADDLATSMSLVPNAPHSLTLEVLLTAEAWFSTGAMDA